jgi:hypothetical protein
LAVHGKSSDTQTGGGKHASKEKGKEEEITTERLQVSSIPRPASPKAGLVFFSHNFSERCQEPAHFHPAPQDTKCLVRFFGNLLTLGIHFPEQSPKLF